MEILHLDQITPDAVILWKWKFLVLNATIFYTWIIMTLITVGSWLVTRNLSTETVSSRWQSLLEVVVVGMRDQISEICQQESDRFLPFIGTLFAFIAISNLLSFVPGYAPPTSSLSTTAALAICVFIAVPFYGIWDRGLIGYLKHFAEPSLFIMPFHILGEISRTVALAVRLFGNVMSGSKVVGILLSLTPFLFPIVMNVLELLIGLIQAYIFSILATVYIASALKAREEKEGLNTGPIFSSSSG
jgi:F-type H+-transporting ATPase subunit a